MTARPDVDEPALKAMLREAASAAACARCPVGTRRTSRRGADGSVEVRCAGCGAPLTLAPREDAPPPRA